LTSQRNQALRLARSDIFFSLDDDINLYPDAAKVIMEVYEADAEVQVALVTESFASGPPASMTNSEIKDNPRSVTAAARRWVERQLSLDGHFVPYAESVATAPVQTSVSHLHVHPSG
jgi:hypothetical protein